MAHDAALSALQHSTYCLSESQKALHHKLDLLMQAQGLPTMRYVPPSKEASAARAITLTRRGPRMVLSTVGMPHEQHLPNTVAMPHQSHCHTSPSEKSAGAEARMTSQTSGGGATRDTGSTPSLPASLLPAERRTETGTGTGASRGAVDLAVTLEPFHDSSAREPTTRTSSEPSARASSTAEPNYESLLQAMSNGTAQQPHASAEIGFYTIDASTNGNTKNNRDSNLLVHRP